MILLPQLPTWLGLYNWTTSLLEEFICDFVLRVRGNMLKDFGGEHNSTRQKMLFVSAEDSVMLQAKLSVFHRKGSHEKI